MKYTKKQIKTATNRIVDSLEWLELSENAKCVQVYGVDYEGDFHEVDNNWREVIADELICFGVENANRKLGPYEDEPKLHIVYYEDDNQAHDFFESTYDTHGYNEWSLSDLIYILTK